MSELSQRKKILFICIFLILAAVGLEVWLRGIGFFKKIDFTLYLKELKNPDRLPEDVYIRDNQLHMALRPNTQVLATTSDFSVFYTINSGGFRDKEYALNKADGIIRCLAYGDSQVFGEGVPYGKRFTDIFENNFSNLEVINCGVPGYGIDQQLLSFAKYGKHYQSDYVILFLSRSSISRYSTGIVKSDGIVDVSITDDTFPSANTTRYLRKNDPFFDSTHIALLSRSYLASYLYYHFSLINVRKRFEEYDRQLWETIHLQSPSQRSRSRRDWAINYTRAIVTKFNELVQEENAHFIVVNLDLPIKAYYGEKSSTSPAFDLIHISRDLSEEQRKYNLSFKYDPHYNPKTHRFIAKKLIEKLTPLINKSHNLHSN